MTHKDETDEPQGRETTGSPIVLTARNLKIVETRNSLPIVETVSLDLRAGQIYGLVGESGSGKTTTALSLLGFEQPGVSIASGTVSVGGAELPLSRVRQLRRMRGKVISYIPQNPGTALNPSVRIGASVTAMARAHGAAQVGDGFLERALAAVGLPSDRAFVRRFPHQLSGGQQQRVCTANSLVCQPPVVVLDEPTTGLDVVTQATVLTELRRLCLEQNTAMLYVTHDLAVVAQIADRIGVMYAGRIVEEGTASQVLSAPNHPYTHGLLSSIPDHVEPRVLRAMPGAAAGVQDRAPGCTFAPRCALHVPECDAERPPMIDVGDRHVVRCIRPDEAAQMTGPSETPTRMQRGEQPVVLKVEGLKIGYRSRGTVVSDVSFSLERGACLALVGESGSGKTTIGRCLVGLQPRESGKIWLAGAELGSGKRSLDDRRRVQIVFQNPMDALNPRQTVLDAISRPLRSLRDQSRKAATEEALRLLDLVRLPTGMAQRYPAEISGGEAQRVGLARALAARPEVIVCDEITSALDVSSQAAVLALLADLRDELGVSLLFITHDLGVVAAAADQVLVLRDGVIVESGPTESVLNSPRNDYTRSLLGAAPSIAHSVARQP